MKMLSPKSLKLYKSLKNIALYQVKLFKIHYKGCLQIDGKATSDAVY